MTIEERLLELGVKQYRDIPQLAPLFRQVCATLGQLVSVQEVQAATWCITTVEEGKAIGMLCATNDRFILIGAIPQTKQLISKEYPFKELSKVLLYRHAVTEVVEKMILQFSVISFNFLGIKGFIPLDFIAFLENTSLEVISGITPENGSAMQ
ncbi:hypothetical protein [Algivirga pacifica]|uniref:YokE-like PH domain-containing protein n=1 Tax=Algivirga pacifica TaxID=1162670 RepID=A0ABP9DDQ0_9BACT